MLPAKSRRDGTLLKWVHDGIRRADRVLEPDVGGTCDFGHEEETPRVGEHVAGMVFPCFGRGDTADLVGERGRGGEGAREEEGGGAGVAGERAEDGEERHCWGCGRGLRLASSWLAAGELWREALMMTTCGWRRRGGLLPGMLLSQEL